MDVGWHFDLGCPAESDKLKDPEVPKADGDEPQFEV